LPLAFLFPLPLNLLCRKLIVVVVEISFPVDKDAETESAETLPETSLSLPLPLWLLPLVQRNESDKPRVEFHRKTVGAKGGFVVDNNNASFPLAA